mmetsp:Transcript_37477/g.111848  ORF Transcript_37477/g.111848 Transcript_37477/m.111848 type:complete len:283 (+) Transcript_37477:552-1400(+)
MGPLEAQLDPDAARVQPAARLHLVCGGTDRLCSEVHRDVVPLQHRPLLPRRVLLIASALLIKGVLAILQAVGRPCEEDHPVADFEADEPKFLASPGGTILLRHAGAPPVLHREARVVRLAVATLGLVQSLRDVSVLRVFAARLHVVEVFRDGADAVGVAEARHTALRPALLRHTHVAALLSVARGRLATDFRAVRLRPVAAVRASARVATVVRWPRVTRLAVVAQRTHCRHCGRVGATNHTQRGAGSKEGRVRLVLLQVRAAFLVPVAAAAKVYDALGHKKG